MDGLSQDLLDVNNGEPYKLSEFYNTLISEHFNVASVARKNDHIIFGLTVDGNPMSVHKDVFTPESIEDFFQNMTIEGGPWHQKEMWYTPQLEDVFIGDVYEAYKAFQRDIKRSNPRITWQGFVEGYQQALQDLKRACPKCGKEIKK